MNKLIAIGLCAIMGISAVLGFSSLEVKADTIHTGDMDTNDVMPGAPEGLTDIEWEYDYQTNEYGYDELIGVTYLDEYYSYLYDDSGKIVGMLDEEGGQVAQYVYNRNDVVTEVYSKSGNDWIVNTDENFIGNLNKMRFHGYYFDEATQCYYIGGTYYDPVQDRYLGMTNNPTLYADYNPFSIVEENIQPSNDVDVIHSVAQQWANALCADGNHGDAITAYSSGWYSGMSDVEVLARAIYCEGGVKYTNEQNAVAWVILNRILSDNPFFSGTTGGQIVRQAGQFSSITGGSTTTQNARIPTRYDENGNVTDLWANATYLACLLITTQERTDWSALVGNTLSGQLYFYSYTTAKIKYNNGESKFSGSSGAFYYDGNLINNVKVLGYSNISSFDLLFQNYNPVEYSRNIYFDYLN